MKANENELNKVMSDLGTIRKEIGRLDSLNKTIDKEVDKIGNQIEHRIEVCEQTPEILDKAEIEFNQLTSILNKKDIPFFVFSILLQCGIQYILSGGAGASKPALPCVLPCSANRSSVLPEARARTWGLILTPLLPSPPPHAAGLETLSSLSPDAPPILSSPH